MKTIGMVSRIEEGKGQDTLIDAVLILKTEIKDIQALIVGEGPDTDLRLKIKKLKLGNNVKLLGFQEDLAKTLRGFDVFVFPTYWSLEGFGMVLLEAMNYGVPIVATNFGPIPEIVKDVAILVPPKDPRSLAEALKKVITNKKLARIMIASGHKRVKDFDIKTIADKYFEILLETTKINA